MATRNFSINLEGLNHPRYYSELKPVLILKGCDMDDQDSGRLSARPPVESDDLFEIHSVSSKRSKVVVKVYPAKLYEKEEPDLSKDRKMPESVIAVIVSRKAGVPRPPIFLTEDFIVTLDGLVAGLDPMS